MDMHNYFKDSVVRRTFAQAIASNPHELYQQADIPTSELGFAEKITDHLESQFDVDAPAWFVREGIRDTQSIFVSALDDTPGMQPHDALKVVHDPVTTLAIAELALHSQARISNYLNKPDRQNYFYIHPSRRQLLLGSKLPDHTLSIKGCPFAGKSAQAEDEIRIDPLFKRFVPWAGTLAVLRYFDMRQSAYQPDTCSFQPVAR